MKLSVITVVYNGADTIERTMRSVLRQIVPPDEYLVIDGKSTDNTWKIVEDYRESFAGRGVKFRTLSEKDNGIYDAMNKGIRLAAGNFVAMLNSDDWYEEDAVKTIKEEYIKTPFDLAYGSINYTGKNGRILVKHSRLDSFVSSRNWNHPSTVVRRDLCVKYPFDLRWKVYADFDWFLKLRNMRLKIHIFPREKVITNFCVGGASINDNLRDMCLRAGEKYAAYRKNGYGRLYWLESYGWEFAKYMFANVNG